MSATAALAASRPRRGPRRRSTASSRSVDRAPALLGARGPLSRAPSLALALAFASGFARAASADCSAARRPGAVRRRRRAETCASSSSREPRVPPRAPAPSAAASAWSANRSATASAAARVAGDAEGAPRARHASDRNPRGRGLVAASSVRTPAESSASLFFATPFETSAASSSSSFSAGEARSSSRRRSVASRSSSASAATTSSAGGGEAPPASAASLAAIGASASRATGQCLVATSKEGWRARIDARRRAARARTSFASFAVAREVEEEEIDPGTTLVGCPSSSESRRAAFSLASAFSSHTLDATRSSAVAHVAIGSRYAPTCSPIARVASAAARRNPAGRFEPSRTSRSRCANDASDAARSHHSAALVSLPGPQLAVRSNASDQEDPPLVEASAAGGGSRGWTTSRISGAISRASSLPIHASAAALSGACFPLRFLSLGSSARTTSDANAGRCSALTTASSPDRLNPTSSSRHVSGCATLATRSASSGESRCGRRHCPRHRTASCAVAGSSALTHRSSDARTPSPTPPSRARTFRPPPSASRWTASHSRRPARYARPPRRDPSGLGASNARNAKARGLGSRAAASGDAATERRTRPRRVQRSVPCSTGYANARAFD